MIPIGYFYLSVCVNILFLCILSFTLVKVLQLEKVDRTKLHNYIDQYVQDYYGHLKDGLPQRTYVTCQVMRDVVEQTYQEIVFKMPNGTEKSQSKKAKVLILLQFLKACPPTLQMTTNAMVDEACQTYTGNQRSMQVSLILKYWLEAALIKAQSMPEGEKKDLAIQALTNKTVLQIATQYLHERASSYTYHN